MRTQQMNAKVKRLNLIAWILGVAILVTLAFIVYIFVPKQEAADALKVRTMMLYDAYVGEEYHLTLEAIQGKQPYTFEVSGLPEGLVYDAASQSITGTASKAGSAEVDVKVTDADKKTGTTKYKFNVADKVPEPVAYPVNTVSAGGFYSAAILQNGDLMTWGDNHSGQLGRKTDAQSNAQNDVAGLALVNAKSVHAAGSTTMAVRKDGTLWAFGQNTDSQFGNGNAKDAELPVFIMDNVAYVSGGSTYTMIIKTDNSLWAFGANKQYQLGTGNLKAQQAPVKIMDDVVSVSCGEYTAVALKKDGTVWAWGQNTHGETGIPDGGDYVSQPTQVPGMTDVAEVSCGYGHTLAIKSDGTLWAWGYNSNGQTGSGGTDDVMTPVKVLENVRHISGGSEFSLAVLDNGELWGAGSNEFGQLGTADKQDMLSFSKIMDGVQEADAGAFHTLVLMTDSSLLAFGRNNSGQLGAGDTADSYEPVKVLDGVLLQ